MYEVEKLVDLSGVKKRYGRSTEVVMVLFLEDLVSNYIDTGKIISSDRYSEILPEYYNIWHWFIRQENCIIDDDGYLIGSPKITVEALDKIKLQTEQIEKEPDDLPF